MFKWSKDIELIEIEAGNIEKINSDLDIYRINIFDTYLENNSDKENTFCHFGIYRNSNNSLVGYLDFQEIDYENLTAELSISIPEKSERNIGYGFEAFILSLNYAFRIRNFNNIRLFTLSNNFNVINMGNKLNLQLEKVQTKIHNRTFNLIKCEIDQKIYSRIEKLFYSPILGASPNRE